MSRAASNGQRKPFSSIAPLIIPHLDRFAPTAINRGVIVSAASSSDDHTRTLAAKLQREPSGHIPAVETIAAKLNASVDFPVPPAPASNVSLPCGMNPFHSHETFFASIVEHWTSVTLRFEDLSDFPLVLVSGC